MTVTKNNKPTAVQDSRGFTSNSRNELIPIISKENQLLVDARRLHTTLKVGRDFSSWIKERIKEYGFKENEDFVYFSPDLGKNPKTARGRPAKEYHLTIDTAKEIAMLERNEVGRAVRRYFIGAEKELRTSRIYAATASLSEMGRGVKPILLNGRRLYPFRKVCEALGYCSRISITNMQKRGWGGLFVKLGNNTYIAEEYVKVMMARAKARAIAAEAKAANPVLPENFGQVPEHKKGGYNGK